MSVSDEITKKIFDKAPDVVSKTYQGAKNLEDSVKGICLILASGMEFTIDNVMSAVRQVAFNKTGNFEYSSQNVAMVELKKSGSVKTIDENITADVMQHFDKYCKKFDVKYNAVLSEREPNNPNYMIFFNGKDDKIIEKVLQEAYADYLQAQKNKGQEKGQNEKESKRKGKDKNLEKESVRAKLAFFRNRVADRDKEQGNVEREHQHSERQR